VVAAVWNCWPAPAIAAALPSSWISPTSGSWTDPSRWTTSPFFPDNDSPAGATYDATINAIGAPYTVTSTADVTVDQLHIDSPDASLHIASGTLASQFCTLSGGATAVQTGGTHAIDFLFTLTGGSSYALSGGTFSPGLIRVGESGEGSLLQTGDSSVIVGPYVSTVGRNGAGTLLIDGPAASFRSTIDGGNTMVFGSGTLGVANVAVQNGASARFGTSEIGSTFGHGTLTVGTGASALLASLSVGWGGQLSVPITGSGTFILDGGSARVSQSITSFANLYVGTTSFGSGTTGAGTMILNNGTLAIDGYLFVYATGVASVTNTRVSVGSFQVVGGNMTFNSGTLDVGDFQISSGGRLALAAGAGTTVRTKSMSVASGAGTLDLADNRLLIDYATTSPLTSIRQSIAAGAITSSAGTGGKRLGYADASDIFTLFPATFGGYSIDNTSLLVAYTRAGDANLDGIVNLADFNRLASHFGAAGEFWSHGDFNYDGMVNLGDFNLIASNFGLGALDHDPTPQDWANLVSVVPEPLNLTAGAVTLLSLRRPRRDFLLAALAW
jgi:hypothetical protein